MPQDLLDQLDPYASVVLRAAAAAPTPGTDGTVPAERHFPVSVVLAHGLFAVVTLVLVLLTALGIGSS